MGQLNKIITFSAKFSKKKFSYFHKQQGNYAEQMKKNCHFYFIIWNLQPCIKLYLIILIIISRLRIRSISFSLCCPIFWAIQEWIIVLPIVTIFTVYPTTFIITVFICSSIISFSFIISSSGTTISTFFICSSTAPICIIVICRSTLSFSFIISSSATTISTLFNCSSIASITFICRFSISITFICFSFIIGITLV